MVRRLFPPVSRAAFDDPSCSSATRAAAARSAVGAPGAGGRAVRVALGVAAQMHQLRVEFGIVVFGHKFL